MPTIAEVRADPLQLLSQREEVHHEEWLDQIAQRNVFYIRGFSWFFRETNANKTFFKEIYPPKTTESVVDIPDLQEQYEIRCEGEIRPLNLQAWRNEVPINWDQPYSWEKAYKGSQPGHINRALNFVQAAKAILLCELYIRRSIEDLQRRRDLLQSMYDNMRIQPAYSYVHGFNRSVIMQILRKNSGFLSDLKKVTQQPNDGVFFAMAERAVVTHSLACRVRKYIRMEFDYISIGDVVSRYDAKRRYKPYNEEFIDVDHNNVDLIAWEGANAL